MDTEFTQKTTYLEIGADSIALKFFGFTLSHIKVLLHKSKDCSVS